MVSSEILSLANFLEKSLTFKDSSFLKGLTPLEGVSAILEEYFSTKMAIVVNNEVVEEIAQQYNIPLGEEVPHDILLNAVSDLHDEDRIPDVVEVFILRQLLELERNSNKQ